MVPALRALRDPPGTDKGTRRRIDAGRVVRAFAVAAGVAALESAGQHPSAGLLVLAAAGLVAMIWGLRVLLPPGTVRVHPGPPAPIALRGLLAGAFFGAESLLPLSLTEQHGFSATAAGLPLAASGVSWALGSWWQGRAVADDNAAHRIALIRAGFLCLVVAMLGLAVSVVPAAPGWLAYPSWLIAGLGAGLTMSSVGVLLLRYTSEAKRGSDSAALQLSDATTSALTTGVAGVLVAAAARGAIGNTAAFVGTDLLMCAVAVVGLAVAGRAHPAPAPQPAAELPARTSI